MNTPNPATPGLNRIWRVVRAEHGPVRGLGMGRVSDTLDLRNLPTAPPEQDNALWLDEQDGRQVIRYKLPPGRQNAFAYEVQALTDQQLRLFVLVTLPGASLAQPMLTLDLEPAEQSAP